MSAHAKDVLVSTAWVEEHLGDADVRIIEVVEDEGADARWRIPGAIRLSWRALQDPLRRDLLGPVAFARLLGSHGIGSEHTVVLYGERDRCFAAYVYWALKYYAHRDVRLMDGPRELWWAEGRPVDTAAPAHPPAVFVPEPGDDTIRALRGDVLAALADGARLVDARSPQEFSGEMVAEPGYEHEGAQRGGHIPGARSIPWMRSLAGDGRFRPASELRELYGAQPALDGEAIIVYCRVGERSAHTWFVLHELLGHPDVRNYDGSWTEWGNLVNVPVERELSGD